MPRGLDERRTPVEGSNIPADRNEAALDSGPPNPSPRMTEMRRERRRRDDGDIDGMARMKLAIPKNIQALAKAEGKTLRWIRDDPGRLQQAAADDWDPVPNVDPVAASRTEEGQLVLHAKYQDWFDEDQRTKTRRLDREEQALQQGGERNPESYTPQGERNRIFRQTGA